MSWFSIIIFVYLLHGNVKAFFVKDNKLKFGNLFTALTMILVFLSNYFHMKLF
jgi:hypothetical protein